LAASYNFIRYANSAAGSLGSGAINVDSVRCEDQRRRVARDNEPEEPIVVMTTSSREDALLLWGSPKRKAKLKPMLVERGLEVGETLYRAIELGARCWPR
jgi:hypothetical protein